jgi:2'-5' RNA ligase
VSRVFVAARLPASLISQVRALDRPARAGLRWTTEDQWHVTLCFLGEVEHGMSELFS